MKATATPLPVLLVVDDDELVLDGLEATFEDDFQVLTAGSAERARELVAEHTIDIVISDDRLPQETGVSFLGWLAQEQPGAVRILLTGFFSEPGDVRRAISQGRMWHYMRKPWEAGSMENIVQRALESRQLALAVQAAERRYQALYDAVPCPLVTADAHGKGLNWNPSFAELFQDWPQAGLSVAERLPEGMWTSLVAQVLDSEDGVAQAQLRVQGPGGARPFILRLHQNSPQSFTVALSPVVASQPPAQAPVPSAETGPSILLLAEDEDQRRLLGRALGKAGMRTVTAENLAHAVSLLESAPPAMVLAQGDIEVVPGLQMLLRRFPGRPILLCTPDVDRPAVQALATRGVQLLAMPYSLADLTDAVKGRLPG